MVNLSVKIGRLKLKNPVMAASGTFGEEYKDLINVNSLGALIAKTITLKPRVGNLPPRVAETPAGMLNSIGLENKGLDFFLEEKLPILKRLKVPIIGSIAGDDEGEFAELAKRLGRDSAISGLEINLSCPNVKHGDREDLIAQDEDAVYKVVKAVRRAASTTLIAKLSPNVANITKMARAAKEAGADAVSLVNTFVGMAIDIDTQRPILGNITGGLSGPAIRPIAIRMVWEVYKKVDIPVIGIGGIMDYKDAVEFILCGAAAIQIGTANFVNPKAPIEIIGGIKEYLARKKIKDVKKLIGALKI
ncbi:MAG: dihydroorotate dehydrogenase [Candidatus Omnitrophota bacterium]|nr:dihydroorotate dehydrogenase [Candidatus Omnitrophota bacterium]